MITRNEVLMGRDALYPLDDKKEANLTKLLEAVNTLRFLYGKPMYVSSGYRPGEFNVKAHGAKNSAHTSCEAVDFHDKDRSLVKFCTPDILEQCGLYMENPKSTLTWTHVQIRTTTSRIFNP